MQRTYFAKEARLVAGAVQGWEESITIKVVGGIEAGPTSRWFAGGCVERPHIVVITAGEPCTSRWRAFRR